MGKTIAVFLFAAVIICLGASYCSGLGFRGDTIGRVRVPEPRLISPSTEEVDLTGKDSLKFEWSGHEGDRMKRDYYDFRLYKGYDMIELTLVYKERVDKGTYSISLKSDMFDDGQVYTWSLRQVYEGSEKSRRSIASFKIIRNKSQEGQIEKG